LHDGFTGRLQKRLFVLGHLPPPLTIVAMQVTSVASRVISY
jgi:hypothetical protein